MSNVVQYDAFQTAPSTLTDDGGPWTASSWVDCKGYSGSWCTRCMMCGIWAGITPGGTYPYSFSTNVVLNTDQYHGVESLDFVWEYTLAWTTSNGASSGASRAWSSSVGNNQYTDNVAQGTAGSSFRHTGWIPKPQKNSDAIPLSINITYSRVVQEDIGFYVKDVKFQITPAASTRQSHTGAIVGGVIGGIVWSLLCLLIGYIIGKRRVSKNQNPRDWKGKPNVPTQEEEKGPMVKPVYQAPPPHEVEDTD